MNKLWRKIIIFVFVIVVLIFVYRAAFYTPKPAVEPKKLEQLQKVEQRVDDSNLTFQQRLEERMAARAKRAEELRDKGMEDFSVAIEDTKYTGAERLYKRILFESKIAINRTGNYQRMVDYCRLLLTEYPDSPQAVEAKKLLGQLPEQEKEKYNITEKEMGL